MCKKHTPQKITVFCFFVVGVTNLVYNLDMLPAKLTKKDGKLTKHAKSFYFRKLGIVSEGLRATSTKKHLNYRFC